MMDLESIAINTFIELFLCIREIFKHKHSNALESNNFSDKCIYILNCNRLLLNEDISLTSVPLKLTEISNFYTFF